MLRFYFETILKNTIINGTKIVKSDFTITKDFKIQADQCPPYQAYMDEIDKWTHLDDETDETPEPEQPAVLDMGEFVITDWKDEVINRPIKYTIQLDKAGGFGQAVLQLANDMGIDVTIVDQTTKRSTTTTTRKRFSDTDKINTLVNSGKTLTEAVEIIKADKIKAAQNNHKNDPDKLNKTMQAIEQAAANNFGYGGMDKLETPAAPNN